MGIDILQRAVAGGSPLQTVTATLPDQPAVAGNLLLGLIGTNANTYGSQVTYPAGWTEITHAGTNSPVFAAFAKKAVGGETGFTVTQTNNNSLRAHLFELIGADADAFLAAMGFVNGSTVVGAGQVNYPMGPLTPPAGDWMAFAAFMQTPNLTTVPSWTGGFNGYDSGDLQTGLGSSNQGLHSATLKGSGASPTLSTTPAWSTSGTPRGAMIVIPALVAAGGATNNEILVGGLM